MPTLERTPSGTLLPPRPGRRQLAQEADAAGTPPQPVPPPGPISAPGPSRLEQLGRLTAGVAHDFNNVLSVIMVCAGEIAAEAEGESQAERAAEIRAAAARGAELSRMLHSHDRNSEPKPELIAIDAAIIDALPLVRRTLGPGVNISLSSERHLPNVLLAPGELERMLLNLAVNSRDAMPAGGAVAIRTGLVAIPPGDPILGTGWSLRVCFSDTGKGMSAEIVDRAAQPHFTTKPRGSGSGLGLATVQSLLRSRGGDLRIASAPGAGATLALLLPAFRASGEPLSL